MKRVLLVLAAGLALSAPAGAAVSVTDVRLWRAPDHTRLVFDLSAPLEYRVLPPLTAPDRLVIDMRKARLRGPLPRIAGGRFLRGLRSGRRDGGTLRMVLDLHRPVRPRTFVLKPNRRFGHRLVIDLYDAAKESQVARTPPPARQRSGLLVAIDAGHGGDDFGARGRAGTREKDVVLAIARELQKKINARPGMRALMTRGGDYYVSLNKRVFKARRQNADLFVSIHADAFRKRRVRGASVYALSQRGASSAQAQVLADKENAADLFGGVSLGDKDDLLARVLLDLSLTQTISDSLVFGKDVLRELKRVGPIHIPQVEQAGFAVLKAPDIPSVLVETAFISNPKEEKLLRSRAQQRKLAAAIFKGIERFAARGRLARPVVVAAQSKRHVVRRGETLSGIAQRYRVSLRSLRSANKLRGDLVRVGQTLRIPGKEG